MPMLTFVITMVKLHYNMVFLRMVNACFYFLYYLFLLAERNGYTEIINALNLAKMRTTTTTTTKTTTTTTTTTTLSPNAQLLYGQFNLKCIFCLIFKINYYSCEKWVIIQSY
jgi:hypothetical protein